jgi:hypothetical protein
MFSDSQHDTKTISAPLLAQDNDDWKPRLNVSDKSFWYTGYIDKTESEVLALLGASPPSDCKKFIRKYSYANILYEDVRCGFVHTYSPTDRASIDDATREIFDAGSSQISYKNTPMQKGFRKIYFPLEWIAAVAKSVARGMDSECARNNKHCFENVGLSTPTLWWLDGA